MQLMSDGDRCPMDLMSSPLDIDFYRASIARSLTNRCTTVLSHKNCLKDKLISKNYAR